MESILYLGCTYRSQRFRSIWTPIVHKLIYTIRIVREIHRKHSISQFRTVVRDSAAEIFRYPACGCVGETMGGCGAAGDAENCEEGDTHSEEGSCDFSLCMYVIVRSETRLRS